MNEISFPGSPALSAGSFMNLIGVHEQGKVIRLRKKPRALPVGLHFPIKEVSMVTDEKIKIQKVDDYRWKIPREGKMKTDGIIYADERMFNDIRKDQSLVQVANVAWLPGIVGHSLAMPDIHWGYGFPIGGVAGFDMDEGIVSPGGVGYDIN
jgi:hypothetical protein